MCWVTAPKNWTTFGCRILWSKESSSLKARLHHINMFETSYKIRAPGNEKKIQSIDSTHNLSSLVNTSSPSFLTATSIPLHDALRKVPWRKTKERTKSMSGSHFIVYTQITVQQSTLGQIHCSRSLNSIQRVKNWECRYIQQKQSPEPKRIKFTSYLQHSFTPMPLSGFHLGAT